MVKNNAVRRLVESVARDPRSDLNRFEQNLKTWKTQLYSIANLVVDGFGHPWAKTTAHGSAVRVLASRDTGFHGKNGLSFCPGFPFLDAGLHIDKQAVDLFLAVRREGFQQHP